MEASATFTKLLGSRANIGKVVRAFEREIAKSIAKDEMRTPTRAEVKRRFDLCVTIFCVLVGDMKWGIERALGRLGEYLRKELDHVLWEPDKRTFWMPSDDR